ncbi:MAG TPA: hypothetical protein VFS40_13765 [Gemmatimonadales bacterium]|nr:hypothetical protein [Gemmatimonadales bacterium]
MPPRAARPSLVALLVLAACGGTETASRPTGAARAEDTVVFGADRRSLDDSTIRAFRSREPDRALLERLLDQYAGLDFLIDDVWQDSTEGKVKAHAWQHDRGEERHAARLAELLRQQYRERYEPVVGDRFRRAGDSIRALGGGEHQVDAFYRAVARTHRYTLAYIDSAAPMLQRPAVRDAVAELRRDLAGEIADLERHAARNLPDSAQPTPAMHGPDSTTP